MCKSNELLGIVERAIGHNLKGPRKDNGEGYEMIPFSADAFSDQIERIRCEYPEYKYDISFIDVGAGAGFRVLQARSMGLKATGIEYDLSYVKLAKKLFNIDLIHGDAFEHGYGKYDIVYFYCPIAKVQKEIQLEKHILKTVRSGTFIIANLGQYINECATYDQKKNKYIEKFLPELQRISKNIYRVR